jgi:hypothetical protein
VNIKSEFYRGPVFAGKFDLIREEFKVAAEKFIT